MTLAGYTSTAFLSAVALDVLLVALTLVGATSPADVGRDLVTWR